MFGVAYIDSAIIFFVIIIIIIIITTTTATITIVSLVLGLLQSSCRVSTETRGNWKEYFLPASVVLLLFRFYFALIFFVVAYIDNTIIIIIELTHNKTILENTVEMSHNQ